MKRENLFQGKRGNWKGNEVSLKIKTGIKPFFTKPQPVPLINSEGSKKDIDSQCEIGAMWQLEGKEAQNRKWAVMNFRVPKKNKEICLVIDFHPINNHLLQTYYPLAIIDDIP